MPASPGLPLNQQKPGRRPDWVNAASLQTALRTSSAVPHLQAAAERERRLAVSTSLAKHGVAPEARVTAQEVAKSEAGHVMELVQHLAKHNEALTSALSDTNLQLRQQQVLGVDVCGGGRGACTQGLTPSIPLRHTKLLFLPCRSF